MCYLCATNAGNIVLRAHYAFMAHRSGVAIQRLVDIGRREVVADGVSAREVSREACAFSFGLTLLYAMAMRANFRGLGARQYCTRCDNSG